MLASEWRADRESVFKSGIVPDDAPVLVAPDLATRSAHLFHRELTKAVSAVLLLTQVVTFADNAAQVAKKVVDGDTPLPSGFDPFQPLGDMKGPFWRQLKHVAPAVFEMAFVRLIDNLTTYLSEVLRECLEARPEILRSDRQVKFEKVLQFETMDELLSHMIDRTVDELAYSGFADLSEWIGKKLGVVQLNGFPAREAIIDYIEVRNCIVHNRSAISPKYARVCGMNADRVGFPITVDIEMMTLAAQATWECVTMLDPVLATKFTLETVPPLKPRATSK